MDIWWSSRELCCILQFISINFYSHVCPMLDTSKKGLYQRIEFLQQSPFSVISLWRRNETRWIHLFAILLCRETFRNIFFTMPISKLFLHWKKSKCGKFLLIYQLSLFDRWAVMSSNITFHAYFCFTLSDV